MITLVGILHVLICLLLIGAVLLQGGENVDITAAFGGTSQAAFGPRGSVTLLAKITWVLAGTFHRHFDHPRRPCLAQGRRFGVRNGAGQNCSGGAGAGEEVEERTSVVSFRSSVRTRPERFLCWALKADDRRVITANVRKWRNWQTHQLEGLTLARAWGFESPLPHHLFLKKSRSQLP